MNAQDWTILNTLREWVTALVAIAGTLTLASAAQAYFKKFMGHRRWDCLGQLSQAVSYLIYPVGFRIAADLAPMGPKTTAWIESGLYILFVLALMNLARQAAMIAIGWSAIRGPKNSDTFQHGFIPILRNLVTLLVFAVGGIMILKYFGYDVMTLVTALGVGSLAIGLAAKDTLSNMISGFTMIIDRNLHPGDKINLGGAIGIVEEIGLRSTRLNMRDGNTLIVPNADLVNTKILNMSTQGPPGTCSTKFRVPLNVPFARVKTICTEIHPQLEKAMKSKGGWVQLASLDEGNQVINTGFWVNDSDQTGDALTDFHVKLAERMASEGIPLLGPPAGRAN